jgi:hypothetical protein
MAKNTDPPKTEDVGKVESVGDPTTRSIQQIREGIRGWIVFALLGAILVVFLAPFCCSALADKMSSVSEKLITGLIGLLGTAIAFYFRDDSRISK